MNAPIEAVYQVGQTLYAVIINPADGTVWRFDTSVWEAFTSGHWADYAVPMAEFAGSGYYRAAYPITTPTVLATEVIYVQAGGTPTLGDVPATALGHSQGANVAAIGQSVPSANMLALTTGLMVSGAVIAGTLTPSSFPTNLASPTNAQYQGRGCWFVTGALAGQVGNIISYDGTTKTIYVGGPFTAAPSTSDVFIVV